MHHMVVFQITTARPSSLLLLLLPFHLLRLALSSAVPLESSVFIPRPLHSTVNLIPLTYFPEQVNSLYPELVTTRRGRGLARYLSLPLKQRPPPVLRMPIGSGKPVLS